MADMTYTGDAGSYTTLPSEMVHQYACRPHVLGKLTEEPDADYDTGRWQPCSNEWKCGRWQHLRCASDTRSEALDFRCNACHEQLMFECRSLTDEEAVESMLGGLGIADEETELTEDVRASGTFTGATHKDGGIAPTSFYGGVKAAKRTHAAQEPGKDAHMSEDQSDTSKAASHVLGLPIRAATSASTHHTKATQNYLSSKQDHGAGELSVNSKIDNILEAYKDIRRGNASGLVNPPTPNGDNRESSTADTAMQKQSKVAGTERQTKFSLFKTRHQKPTSRTPIETARIPTHEKKHRQDVSSTAPAADSTERLDDHPLSTLDLQALHATITSFCVDFLWLKYCDLSSNILDSSLLRALTETKIDGKGVKSSVHSPVNKWLTEMPRQIIMLLKASRSENTELIVDYMRQPGFKGRDAYRMLKDEVVYVTNRGKYRRKRKELGLLLEMSGIDDQGTHWQP